MKERIEAIIRHERISPSQLADNLGVQRSGVSHILSGRNKPSLDFLYKLLTCYPNISGDWLITGKGAMLADEKSSKTLNKEQLILEVPDKPLKKSFKVPQKESKPVEKVVQKRPESKEEPTHGIPMFNSEPGKKIERILVFYSDKTFSEYKPE
jgi:transcriptional regulator with XRE-family HTH domain